MGLWEEFWEEQMEDPDFRRIYAMVQRQNRKYFREYRKKRDIRLCSLEYKHLRRADREGR
jgi:hypothetical protein